MEAHQVECFSFNGINVHVNSTFKVGEIILAQDSFRCRNCGHCPTCGKIITPLPAPLRPFFLAGDVLWTPKNLAPASPVADAKYMTFEYLFPVPLSHWRF